MKSGIVCDNYKVNKFKTELAKAGFTEFTEAPFQKEKTTIIQVTHDNSKLNELEKLCKNVELYFKRRN